MIPNNGAAMWAQRQGPHDRDGAFAPSGKSLVAFMEYGGAGITTWHPRPNAS